MEIDKSAVRAAPGTGDNQYGVDVHVMQGKQGGLPAMTSLSGAAESSMSPI